MSIFFGLLFARRFFCCPAFSLSPGRTGGLFPRINAPNNKTQPLPLSEAVELFVLFNFSSSDYTIKCSPTWKTKSPLLRRDTSSCSFSGRYGALVAQRLSWPMW